MNNKLADILRGVFIIVLGVLVIVCGAGTAVDTYFGVVSIIAGVILLAAALYGTVKRVPVAVSGYILGPVLITIAIALFIGKLSFAVLINLFVYVIMGLGFGIALLGIVTLIRRQVILGLGEIVLGALLVLFTALYFGVPEFQTAFWWIVGTLMIVFGIAVIVLAIVDKKSGKRK